MWYFRCGIAIGMCGVVGKTAYTKIATSVELGKNIPDALWRVKKPLRK